VNERIDLGQPPNAMAFVGPALARAIAAKVGRVPVARDRRRWIEEKLVIASKSRAIIPLRFNEAQIRTWAKWEEVGLKGIRQDVLKARQEGISTLIEAFMFEDTIHVPNTNTAIISKDTDETARKLAIMKLFYQGLPDHERPTLRYDSKNEMVFLELGSRIYIGSAGHRSFGRGDTIHNAHCSEGAFWPDFATTLKGLGEAVPADGNLWTESTANGAGTPHHQHYLDARAGVGLFRSFFLPWWIHREYREPAAPGDPPLDLDPKELSLVARFNLDHDQLRWRRHKKADLGDTFEQEYPATDDEAFLYSGRSRFDREALLALTPREPLRTEDNGALRIYEEVDSSHRYYIGADCAEGLPTGDFDAAHVIDGPTGREVATLWGQWPPVVFADKLVDLAANFNMALIAVERNNHGHAVLARILFGGEGRRAYPSTRVYHHVFESQPRAGWPTDTVSKPIMESGLDLLLKSHPECFADGDTVSELISIVYRKDGSVGAPEGGHDDRFMSRGIAEQCRQHGPMWEHMSEESTVVYDDHVKISPY
jgi:hypothetical protein